MQALLANPALIGLIALAALSVGGIAYAFLFNSIETEKNVGRRLKSVKRADTDRGAKMQKRDRAQEALQRRKQVTESLEKLDEKNKDRNAAILKPGIEGLMMQAGMTASVTQFWCVSAVVGVIGVVIPLVLQQNILICLGIGFAAGALLPRMYVKRKRTKRCKKFLQEFPNALDIIVRAIKSGLPLNDGLRLIASEAKEPVKSEFQRMIENQQMGMSTPDAIGKMYERVPIAEANFFGIVIAIQMQAGGNLSEALGNLSNVLRSRKKMRDKVSALSMEAKASGAIIAALPFVVACLVTFVDNDFLLPLWERETGNLLLGIAAGLMVTGIGIMKKMISFEV